MALALLPPLLPAHSAAHLLLGAQVLLLQRCAPARRNKGESAHMHQPHWLAAHVSNGSIACIKQTTVPVQRTTEPLAKP